MRILPAFTAWWMAKNYFLSFFCRFCAFSVCHFPVIFLSFCSAAVIPPVIFVSFCDSSAFFGSVLLSVHRACPSMCCKALGVEQLKDEGPGIGAGKGGPASCWSRGRSDVVGVGGVAGPAV